MTNTANTPKPSNKAEVKNIFGNLLSDCKMLLNDPETFFRCIFESNRLKESLVIIGTILVGHYMLAIAFIGVFLTESGLLLSLFASEFLAMGVFFASVYMVSHFASKKATQVEPLTVKQCFVLYAYGSLPILLSLVPFLLTESISFGLFNVFVEGLQVLSCLLIAFGIAARYEMKSMKAWLILGTSTYCLYELANLVARSIH